MTSSIPSSAATDRAVASSSPVSSTGARPSVAQPAHGPRCIRRGACRPDTQDRTDAAVPGDDDRRRATVGRPCDRATERPGRDRRPSGVPETRSGRAGRPRRESPSTVPTTPKPGERAEIADRRPDPGARSRRRSHAATTARAIGCSGAALDRGRRSQRPPRSDSPAASRPRVSRHPAGRQGARLVEDDGVDASRPFERLRAGDEDARLRRAPRPDQQGDRRRQAERARTRDDEHGDRGGERLGCGAAREHPADERQRRRARARPARRPPTRGRRAAGCGTIRAAPLRRSAPSARAGCPPRSASRERRSTRRATIDRAGHLVARATSTGTDSPVSALDVDRGRTLDDDSVGRDLLTRSHARRGRRRPARRREPALRGIRRPSPSDRIEPRGRRAHRPRGGNAGPIRRVRFERSSMNRPSSRNTVTPAATSK